MRCANCKAVIQQPLAYFVNSVGFCDRQCYMEFKKRQILRKKAQTEADNRQKPQKKLQDFMRLRYG